MRDKRDLRQLRFLVVFIGIASVGWVFLAIEQGTVLGWIVALAWIAASTLYVISGRRNRRAVRNTRASAGLGTGRNQPLSRGRAGTRDQRAAGRRKTKKHR